MVQTPWPLILAVLDCLGVKELETRACGKLTIEIWHSLFSKNLYICSLESICQQYQAA